VTHMSDENWDLPGYPIAVVELHHPLAITTSEAIERHPYCRLIECRRLNSGDEFVIFDVDVEVGQRAVHDVRRVERIGALFWTTDDLIPNAFALRRDFPVVPHLNIWTEPFRGLCLFDEPPEELLLSWTAERFLERIREWLALTARGKLHAEDQPLEPLLPEAISQIVIPHDLPLDRASDEILIVGRLVDNANGRRTLFATRPKDPKSNPGRLWSMVSFIVGDPQTHGIITATPRSLRALHDFLRSANVDLLGTLRARLRGWLDPPHNYADLYLVLVVCLPKTREPGGVIESYEHRAFLCGGKIADVGVDIGIWGKTNGRLGVNVPVDESRTGEYIDLALLNVHLEFSREAARRQNALPVQEDPRIALIGVGALGSQLFGNLVRMGVGRWSLIDNDLLLPHNLARHLLTEPYIGQSKATATAAFARQMLTDDTIAAGLAMNALKSAESEELGRVFTEADVILDVSTSVPVARHLVHGINSPARRVSVFLNPAGTDLVVLAEDRERRTLLDSLEMLYYRGLVHEPHLRNHLLDTDERLRYASGCRDVSSTIAQDLVALHSGVGARALREIMGETKASVSVWHCDPRRATVERYDLPVALTITYPVSGWTIYTDQSFLEGIQHARAEKLPNETGGVLVGSYDMQRKIIYVVDTLLSPPDSFEWPTVYIRGTDGLREDLSRIEQVTRTRLEYVGEWHSHPDAAGCLPSNDDRQAFAWLSDLMGEHGLPPLMLILGNDAQRAFHVDRMEQ